MWPNNLVGFSHIGALDTGSLAVCSRPKTVDERSSTGSVGAKKDAVRIEWTRERRQVMQYFEAGAFLANGKLTFLLHTKKCSASPFWDGQGR